MDATELRAKKMFHAEPNPDRSLLRFEEAVLDSFSFLRSEFGFRVVESEVTRVRYESEDAFVNVYHGRSSYEIGCEIGLLQQKRKEDPNALGEDAPETAFSIWEIARMGSAPGVTDRTFYQASTSHVIAELVPRLADLVKNFGRRALSGDRVLYKALEHAHSAWFEEYQKETMLMQIRRQVVDAWQARDFHRVVQLLEPVMQDLTPAEVRKLEYARSRLPS
ncbi:MAG: hypothetical protein ACREX4_24865 [Gammaproteobacteria bacterium]